MSIPNMPSIQDLFRYWSGAESDTTLDQAQRFEPARRALENVYWQIQDQEDEEPNVADTVGLMLLCQLREIQSQEQSRSKGFACPLPPLPAETYARVGGWEAFWHKVNELGGQETIFKQFKLDSLIGEYLDEQEEPDFWPWFYSKYYTQQLNQLKQSQQKIKPPPQVQQAQQTQQTKPVQTSSSNSSQQVKPVQTSSSSSSQQPSIKLAAPTSSFNFSPSSSSNSIATSSATSSAPNIAPSSSSKYQTRQQQQKPTARPAANPPKNKQREKKQTKTEELLLPSTWVLDDEPTK